ncbi:MAG: hypothetical protein ACTSQK_10570, partial [Candidatus Heimdallarchaeota archaeon]
SSYWPTASELKEVSKPKSPSPHPSTIGNHSQSLPTPAPQSPSTEKVDLDSLFDEIAEQSPSYKVKQPKKKKNEKK